MKRGYGTDTIPEGSRYGTGQEGAKRVGIYARVSTEEQARGGVSLDAQLEQLSKYAQGQGWRVIDHYVDAGISGSTTKRPSFQRLMKDAELRSLDVVLVYKFDRFSRSALDLIMTTNDLAKWGVDFCSVTEQVDTTTPMGKLFLRLMGILAEFELDLIKERTRFGMDKKARDGYAQQRAPFGYRFVDGELVINPEEAETIRRIYEGEAQGKSLSEVSRDVGIPKSTVRRILNNPIYRGMIKWRGKTVPGKHKPIIPHSGKSYGAQNQSTYCRRSRVSH